MLATHEYFNSYTYTYLCYRIKQLVQKQIAHARVCPMTCEDSVFPDNCSAEHEGIIHPIPGTDDVDLHEEQPIAGPCSTPLRPMTPDSTHLTLISLTPSATQGHSPPSLRDSETVFDDLVCPFAVTLLRNRSFCPEMPPRLWLT